VEAQLVHVQNYIPRWYSNIVQTERIYMVLLLRKSVKVFLLSIMTKKTQPLGRRSEGRKAKASTIPLTVPFFEWRWLLDLCRRLSFARGRRIVGVKHWERMEPGCRGMRQTGRTPSESNENKKVCLQIQGPKWAKRGTLYQSRNK
jgi:hypothetical protein